MLSNGRVGNTQVNEKSSRPAVSATYLIVTDSFIEVAALSGFLLLSTESVCNRSKLDLAVGVVCETASTCKSTLGRYRDVERRTTGILAWIGSPTCGKHANPVKAQATMVKKDLSYECSPLFQGGNSVSARSSSKDRNYEAK